MDYFSRSTKLNKQSKRDDDFVGPGTSTDSIANANDTSSVSCLLPTEITTVNTESQDSSSMSHTTGSTSTSSETSDRSVPKDIAVSLHQSPVQPVIAFPPRKFVSKNRSFNSEWYIDYSWLEYSVEKDAAFCYACRFFTTSTSGRSDVAFTTTGFNDWKHALGKKGGLLKHSKSQVHAEAMLSWKYYIQMKRSNNSVADKIGSARAQHIAKNVHYIRTVAEVILLCGQQEIALRGHRESEDLLNRGNFVEILKLIALHDKDIQDRVQHSPKNGLYTSPEILNCILHIMGDMVRKMVCDGVKNAGIFTFMADESKDYSKNEQFSIVYERFLTFVHATSCNAVSLTCYITTESGFSQCD